MPLSTPQLQALSSAVAALSQARANTAAVFGSIPVEQPPAPPPPPPPPAPPPPPPGPGTTLYFAADGNNANPGTEASPKRDLTGINLNTLPAGSALRFNRGDTFQMSPYRLANTNATVSNPVTFEAYGVGQRPLLQWSGNVIGFEFGSNFGDQTAHLGYAFKGLHLRSNDPDGSNSWAFWAKNNVSDVLIEDCEIANWRVGLNSQAGDADSPARFTIRGNIIRQNRDMGIQGAWFETIIEDNDFSEDATQTSHFVHRVYLRGGDRNIVRRNRMVSSLPARSGCFTFHGYVQTSLIVEDNVLEYGPGGDEGAWLLSFIPDTGSAPGGWQGLIVRRNRLVNAGNNALHLEAAPGAIVEDNTFVLTHERFQMAVGWADDFQRPQDLKGGGVMRGNRAIGPAGAVMTFSAPAGTDASDNLRVIV